MVSKARLDLPDPDSPVNTIRESLGRSSDTSLRLCSRAPRITRRSATAFCSPGHVGAPPDDGHVMVSGGTDKNGVPKIPSLAARPGIRRVPSPACHAVREDGPGYGKRDGPAAPQGSTASREHCMDDEARRSMASIGEATDRLLASAATLTDAAAREPSLLPGWTRGHVLTHVARNADGLGNLLRWA